MPHIKCFDELTSSLRQAGKRKRVAVACPADAHTEYAVRRALDEQVADFVLVEDSRGSCGLAALEARYPGRVETICADSPDAAARLAVGAVREGRADVLMKGCLNTDNLLHAVLDKERGLIRPGSVMSHVTAIEAPGYGKMLFATDVAVIPRPTTEQFDAMLRYATAVCRAMGTAAPRVALIHCTEKVSDKFPHTISYDERKLRAGRGDYGDACVDGPMDVKTACDAESGRLKGICSAVAGTADVLVFPCIEAGNTFYKTMSLFGHARMAGILCGTTAPVVVASRADSGESKFTSLALACLTGPVEGANASKP